MVRKHTNVHAPVEHAALHVDDVSKTYGDAPALNPISLDIAKGERVALIGHNGSGKTTLIRIAAGLLDATTGEVKINGHDAGSLPARASLSFIADQPTFYDDLTLWEHLEYVARLHGVEDWEQAAADLLGHLGLYERADDMPNRFSRGLKQKAAIALGFIRPFDLLLVDEPFVEHVQHLEERRFVADLIDCVTLEMAGVLRTLLTPHLEGEILQVAHL